MSKLAGLLMQPLIRPADPGIDPYLPDGPNFSVLSGAASTISLILGIILLIAFITGLAIFLNGLRKFRLGNRDTGQGAKGVGSMLSGAIIAAGSLIAIPFFRLIVEVASSFVPQIG